MAGWIKLHRDLLDWEWYTDTTTLTLYIHLMLSANIIPDKALLGYTLQPGQLITTLPKLAAETGLSEKQIRRSLGNLEKSSDISQSRTNKFRLITLEKWGFLQGSPADEGRQRADKGQTEGRQRAGVNKELKNKEFKNISLCGSREQQPRPKNRFVNYPQSDWDFDELERLERKKRDEDADMLDKQISVF